MTLTPPLQLELYKALGHFRGEGSSFTGPRWTDAEIHSATKALALVEGDVPSLMIQAWTQAARPSNERAVCITWPLPTESPTRQAAPPLISPPKVVTEWCETHLVDARLRPDGQRACCWADTADPVKSPRRSRPAPPGIREQVAGSLRVKETETK